MQNFQMKINMMSNIQSFAQSERNYLLGIMKKPKPLKEHPFFGLLSGLSPDGGEYVRHADKHYGQAVKKLHEAKEAITTQSIKATVNELVKMAIRSFGVSI